MEAALPSALGRRRGRHAGSLALAELVPRLLSGLLAQGPSSVPFRSSCACLPASPGRPGAWSWMDPSPGRSGPAGPLQTPPLWTRSANSIRLGTDCGLWLRSGSAGRAFRPCCCETQGSFGSPGSLTSPGAPRNTRRPQPIGVPASALTPPGVLPQWPSDVHLPPCPQPAVVPSFTARAQAEASAGGAALGGAGGGRTWAGQGWKVQEGFPRLSVTLVSPIWPLALQAVPVSLHVTPSLCRPCLA